MSDATSTTLKQKVLAVLIAEMDPDKTDDDGNAISVQASMVAQAIQFLKAFPEADEPGDPAKLSPMLAKVTGQGFAHTPLTRQ